MFILALFNAFITRVLFCLHVLVSVILVVLHTNQKLYWCFLIGLIFMFIEMLYVMIKRKGTEYKLFWPSCFLYLSAIVPVIWVMEIDLLQHRLDERDQILTTSRNISSKFSWRGFEISASIDTEVAAKKVCELGVLLFIIFGRWLLPRGKLTRDQLSNLLLAYIGMGADILDLFEPLTHRNVKYNVTLTYTTLTIFTWSMLQFCIIAMATAGSDDNNKGLSQQEIEKEANDLAVIESGPKNYDPKMDAESSSNVEPVEVTRDVGLTGTDDHGNDPDNQSFASSATTEDSREVRDCTNNNEPQNDHPDAKTSRWYCGMSADLVAILTSLLMHDGPFLIFRLVLLGKFQVTSEIHLFFTAKNALTVTIMLYRLYSLVHVSRAVCPADKEKEDRRSSKAAAA